MLAMRGYYGSTNYPKPQTRNPKPHTLIRTFTEAPQNLTNISPLNYEKVVGARALDLTSTSLGFKGLGFRVKGLGFRDWGEGFRV